MHAIHKGLRVHDDVAMDHKKLLGGVIRRLRKAEGLTQPALSEATEIDQGAISRIENGKQAVTDDQMVAIARALNRHVSELWAAAEGEHELRSEHTIAVRVPAGVRAVPLIGWVQAGKWTEAESAAVDTSSMSLVVTTARVSRRSFALDVRGDSMTNPRGWPTFPEGTRIIVDPNVAAINGSLVIAQVAGEPETTFKKLVIDAGRHILVPLNPQYPTISIEGEIRICGVVVAVGEKPFEEAGNNTSH